MPHNNPFLMEESMGVALHVEPGTGPRGVYFRPMTQHCVPPFDPLGALENESNGFTLCSSLLNRSAFILRFNQSI